MTQPDPADYYERKGYASWDIIEAFELTHYESCILKYLLRWRRKYTDPEKQREDIRKMGKYVARLERQHFGGIAKTESGYYIEKPTAPVSPVSADIL